MLSPCLFDYMNTKPQFAKSQAVSNVPALQIFERKVLLSIWTVEKFSNVTLFRQTALQNLQRKNLGFSETDLAFVTLLP